jgi:hypothetical protein
MNNLTQEYTRTRSQFLWCLEEQPQYVPSDEDWLRLLGTGDCYCELLWMESVLLEGMEGLA